MGTRYAHKQNASAANPSRRRRRWVFIGCLLLLGSSAFWFYASIVEFQTGRRLWSWSAYAFCGRSQPATLPQTVRIGLYEEFPKSFKA